MGSLKHVLETLFSGIIHSRHWRSLLILLRDRVVGPIDVNLYSCRTRVAHMDPGPVSGPILFFAFFGELSQ